MDAPLPAIGWGAFWHLQSTLNAQKTLWRMLDRMLAAVQRTVDAERILAATEGAGRSEEPSEDAGCYRGRWTLHKTMKLDKGAEDSIGC